MFFQPLSVLIAIVPSKDVQLGNSVDVLQRKDKRYAEIRLGR